MHQIRFRPGLRPGPTEGAYGAPADPLAKGPTSNAERKGTERERERRRGRKATGGPPPLSQIPGSAPENSPEFAGS